MVYTDEAKKKLDDILEAFGDHIENQSYFDIVYSKKIGYVWIVVDHPGDAGAERLDTPEVMLDHLFMTSSAMWLPPRESTSLNETSRLTEQEEAEVRRRITALLKKIEGGADEYLDYLDEYIQDHQNGCCENDE